MIYGGRLRILHRCEGNLIFVGGFSFQRLSTVGLFIACTCFCPFYLTFLVRLRIERRAQTDTTVIHVIEIVAGACQSGLISIFTPLSVRLLAIGPAMLFSGFSLSLFDVPRVVRDSPVLEPTVPSGADRRWPLNMLSLQFFEALFKKSLAEHRGVHRRCVVEVKFATFDCRHDVAYLHCFDAIRFRLALRWISSFGLKTQATVRFVPRS